MATAQQWLRGAVGSGLTSAGWTPGLSLSGIDFRALRKLRAYVQEMLTVRPGQRLAGPYSGLDDVPWYVRAQLVSDLQGRHRQWLASATWSETLLARPPPL